MIDRALQVGQQGILVGEREVRQQVECGGQRRHFTIPQGREIGPVAGGQRFIGFPEALGTAAVRPLIDQRGEDLAGCGDHLAGAVTFVQDVPGGGDAEAQQSDGRAGEDHQHGLQQPVG